MKRIIMAVALLICVTNVFGQNGTVKEPGEIKVPDFADASIKKFYQTYSDHLIKCVKEIRKKNESVVVSLFKDPGQQLVSREKIIAKELVKDPVEKRKYLDLAAQLYPYLKEVEQSEYYKRMYGR